MSSGSKKMYGVQKVHLKNLTKKEFLALRQLCRLSKNMYNVGLYNVRQHFFETKEFLTYESCGRPQQRVETTSENAKKR
ncbi:MULTISPECIES: hypothetical protein [Bacillus]|uniref:hypothetical protein n=1 Tax=Bacillus TaxID=1386 RepID=UPI0015E0791C|nr:MULTISPECIES: hypothetical protein [Bacillus]